jgi:uncharacterized protein DUF1496
MVRGLIGTLVGLACLGMASAAAEQRAGFGPVCLYGSKTYSEGAFVCVQKSLMLVCSAEEARMSWKPVPEKDLNDRCTAPTVPHYPAEPRVHNYRRHPLFRRIHRPIEGSAKCFVFNGRQYCE